jgi:hypothetical protein
MDEYPAQEVKAVIHELETQLAALRVSMEGASSHSLAEAEATKARDNLREALKLVTASSDVVACW